MHFKSNDQIFEGILEQLFQKTGRKHEVHYSQGQGALIVEYGKPLKPENIVLSMNDVQLNMVRISGGNININ